MEHPEGPQPIADPEDAVVQSKSVNRKAKRGTCGKEIEGYHKRSQQIEKLVSVHVQPSFSRIISYIFTPFKEWIDERGIF
jgi:hypothetical protein